jgi:hypothetical protein
LRAGGWTTESALGGGASLLARDPDGNLLEFVETRRAGLIAAELAGAGSRDRLRPGSASAPRRAVSRESPSFSRFTTH